MEKYTINVAGLKRDLKLCPLDDKIDIAAFIMFSDVELTIKSAEELIKKAPECDVVSGINGSPVSMQTSCNKAKPQKSIAAIAVMCFSFTNQVPD